MRHLLPVAVEQGPFQRVEQVHAGLEAGALHAHECIHGAGRLQVRTRAQTDLAEPGGALGSHIAELVGGGSHGNDCINAKASASRPAWSSASKRACFGLSRSNTPSRLPSAATSGTTSSELDAESQAMCPGNACTSSIRWVCRVLAAAPQTPLSSGIRTQAGSPWNGPTTSSTPSKK